MNVKMPKILGTLTFMSRVSYVLNCVEHEKSYLTSELNFSGIKTIIIRNSSKMTEALQVSLFTLYKHLFKTISYRWSSDSLASS